MQNKELTLEESIYFSRYLEEVDRSITLQIELNKMIKERDHYKSELEKLIEDKSKPKDKESTKK